MSDNVTGLRVLLCVVVGITVGEAMICAAFLLLRLNEWLEEHQFRDVRPGDPNPKEATCARD